MHGPGGGGSFATVVGNLTDAGPLASSILHTGNFDYMLMTMVKKLRSIPAGEFKAKALAILDEIADTGETIVITKRGKPVAQIMPASPEAVVNLRGTIIREVDILSPVLPPWD